MTKPLGNSKSDVNLQIEIEREVPVKNTSFHSSIASALMFVQFFGVMPLYGLLHKEPNFLKFHWISLRTFFSIYNAGGTLISSIFCFARFARDGLLLDKTGTFAFYICNFFGTIEFIHIARKWHVIIHEWSLVEIAMRNYGYIPNLKRRFKIMTIIVMSLALVEHFLFIANSLATAILECENYSLYPVEIYFGIAFPHYFAVTSYSHWKAVMVELANVLSTVMWNFTDLFIILISSALAVRLKQITTRLQENTVLYEHEHFWRSVRDDYNQLWRLSRTIDEHIAPLVTISFISNLFFICVQLYNSIKPRSSMIETVYFFFSFGFLLGRTLAVSLYAAWINDESKKPLHILYCVDARHYCTEIRRFIQQIATCPFGITGSNFFTVTRSFTLQVAGTIVTFELMLLQFGPLLGNEGSLYTINVCIK